MAKQGYSIKRKLCIFFLGVFCIGGGIVWWAGVIANREYAAAMKALADDGRIIQIPDFVEQYPKDIDYFDGDYSQSTMAYLHTETVPILDSIYERQWPWEMDLKNQNVLVYTENINSLEMQEEIIQILKDKLGQPLTQPEDVFEHVGVRNTILKPLKISYLAIRDSGSLLSWSAYIAAEKGDINESLETYGSVFQLAQHICQLPTIVSSMMAMGTIFNTRVPLTETIIDTPYSEEAMESFSTILESTSIEEYFKIGWKVEMLSVIEFVERMRNKNDPEIIALKKQVPSVGLYESIMGKIVEIGVSDFIFSHDRAMFIRGYHETLKILDDPLVDIDNVQFNKWKEEHTSWRTLMTKVSLNSPTRSRIGILQCELYIEQLKIAIAVNRFTQANQHYPESMDMLVPTYINTAPTNPLTQKSMKISYEDMLFYGEEPEIDKFNTPYLYFNLAEDVDERRLLIY